MVGISLGLILTTYVDVAHRIWVTVLLCVGNILLMCCLVAGSATSAVDISPRFVGVIYGFGNTVSQSFALFAPLVVDWIVTDKVKYLL